MELCDIYNENREKTGRVHKRSQPLEDGEFLLVTGVWIVNSRNELLITKRAPEKRYMPNRWENPAGHARAGETGLQAMVRELEEETGIRVQPSELTLFAKTCKPFFLGEEYLLVKDVDLKDVRLQPGETCDVRWISEETLNRMIQNGEMSESLGIKDPEVWAAFKNALKTRTNP